MLARQRKFLFVERGDRFPRFRTAHFDAVAAQKITVERVHGLPQFE